MGSEKSAEPKGLVPALLACCIAAFFAALALRLAFILDASDSPFLAHRLIDEQDYHGLAEGLLRGRWPGAEALFRPPLYPIFLAATYRLFGDDVFTVRLVQVGLGALAAPLTVWIGARTLGSVRQGLATGLIVAACGPLVYYDAQLLSTSLDVLLVLATVALMLRAEATQKSRDWLLAGAIVGLSATNRGSMLLVIPVAAAWAFATRDPVVARRTVAKRLALFASAAVLVISPLAWHNARNDERPEASYAPAAPRPPASVASVATTIERIATGRYCALGWAGGVNLYMGNRPDILAVNRDSHVAHFDWFEHLNAEPWKNGATTAHEHSAWFISRTRQYIVGHPIAWLGLVGHKVLEVMNGYEVPRGTSPYAEREDSHVLSLLLWDRPLRFPSGLLLPLGAAGAWALRRDRRALLVSLIMATQLVFVVTFFVTSRYRAPALPLAGILAVGLVARVLQRMRAGQARTPRMVAAGVGIGLLVIGSNIHLEGQELGRSAVEEFDLGVELVHEGKSAEAMQHFHASIAISPELADAHVFLGILDQAEGHVDAAIEEYHVALRLEPSNPVGGNALGTALLSKNDLDGAEQVFRAVALANARFPEPRFWMGYVLMTRGDAKGALPWLEEARALNYSDPRLLPMIEDAKRRNASN